MKQDRYPGAHSFGDSNLDQQRFFGREQEQQEIINKILSMNLLVLFGKSGLGKTSLLQAAVFPRLRARHLLPLKIRVNRRDVDPVNMIMDAVQTACREQDVELTVGQDAGLWEFFKTSIFWKEGVSWTPVLILDQFEEIFTLLDKTQRDAIAAQLGELVSGSIPQRVRQQLNTESQLSDAAPDVKLMISLREEYVGALQELFPSVPAILNHRVRLTSLAADQVRQAVLEPAKLSGDHFVSRPFTYQEAAFERLFHFLACTNSGKERAIEPFQLQILCHHIEKKILQRQQKDAQGLEVLRSDLGSEKDMQKILHGFYLDAIQVLPNKKIRKEARNLCEFGLLSAQGFRESLSQRHIMAHWKLSEKDLETLVDARLLRKEPQFDSFTYELTHDSLTQPIMQNRPFRLPKWMKWVMLTLVMLFILVFVFQQYQEAALQKMKQDFQNATREQVSALRDQQAATVATAQTSLKKSIGLLANEGDIEASLREQQTLLQLFSANSLDIEPEMVWIPAGTFMMGSPLSEADRDDDEKQHRVQIKKGFWMGQYETTFAQYDAFCVATGRDLANDAGWGRADRPVINVSWRDAVAYTVWLSEQTGKDYRLPTEAQWEYAARAGSTTPFSTGRCLSTTQANYNGNYPYVNCAKEKNSKKTKYRKPTIYHAQTLTVGSFEANAFGLHDMHGNVWEWTSSLYHRTYDGYELQDSSEDSSDEARSVRGGSWSYGAFRLRSASRNGGTASGRYGSLGFRVSLVQDD